MTETVKTCATEGCDRAAVGRFEHGGVGSDHCQPCLNAIAALSSRTHEPAEWQVRDAQTAAAYAGTAVPWDHMRIALRAASITPPAPERSKEEVTYQCREIGEGGWRDCTKEEYDRLALDPHHDTRALEPSPIHKGEAEPAWFAVQTVSGAHVGMWQDEKIARRVFTEEYPDGRFIPLYVAPMMTPLVRLSSAQALIAAKDARIEELEAMIRANGTPRFNAALDRAETAEAQVKRLTEDNEAACNDLRSFMTSFVREHFPDNTGWKPFPDLPGMLTQMDNASTIARDYKTRIKALEEALTKPITMQDVRLYAGEGKLTATDVLEAAGIEMRSRARATLNSREKAE